ncbi:hypothetical protein FOL47_001068, partial [Perkinsus chesapeaki]
MAPILSGIFIILTLATKRSSSAASFVGNLSHPSGTYTCRDGINATGSLTFGGVNMGFDMKLGVGECHIRAGSTYGVADAPGDPGVYNLVTNAAGGELEEQIDACKDLFPVDFASMLYIYDSPQYIAASRYTCMFKNQSYPQITRRGEALLSPGTGRVDIKKNPNALSLLALLDP